MKARKKKNKNTNDNQTNCKADMWNKGRPSVKETEEEKISTRLNE